MTALPEDDHGVMTWGELYLFLRASGHQKTAQALRLAKDSQGLYIAHPDKPIGEAS